MNQNSENPKIGREFQEKIARLAEKQFHTSFRQEVPMPVGVPSKDHKFDVVSMDKGIVIECKCYTWTNGNNVPSAKMSTLNEAVLYMRSLVIGTKKILVMKKSIRMRTLESLATYYCRTYGHLLDDIEVWEVDELDNITVVRTST